jgi:hypothetical protein
MSKILVRSNGPDSWRQFLAQPEKQWVTGYSARTLAHAWESAGGVPDEVADILGPAFGLFELLLTIPEHKTELPGGRRESQSDVFALIRHETGLATCTIEGKVDEPFGPLVGEWMKDASPGKKQRIAYICDLLGLSEFPAAVHYQLLHRTASALIEAERFHAGDAAMIVHSFSPERRWFEAYERFCEVMTCRAEVGVPAVVTVPSGRRLALGWACGEQRFREM